MEYGVDYKQWAWEYEKYCDDLERDDDDYDSLAEDEAVEKAYGVWGEE